MNEDFTEEEFEDELPEGVEFAESPAPIPKQKAPRAPAPQAQAPQSRGRPRTAPVAAAAEETATARFSPFIVSRRVGVLDNETGQSLMEDKDTNTLLLGLVTKLLNDVDDIKKNL